MHCGRMIPKPNRMLLHLILLSICLQTGGTRCLAAQARADKPEEEQAVNAVAKEAPAQQEVAVQPLSRFLTLDSPIDDGVFARVSNAALELQSLALREDRPAFLFLEIPPGTSLFHQVQGLAKFLSSSKVSRVKTIAWVPQTVTGNHVLLALACREIVIHPDAELGDMGRGQALDPDEQQSVLSIIDRRHNPKLSRALVSGMMDPSKQVLQVKIDTGRNGAEEDRVVTSEELKTLRENKAIIRDVKTIKEAGAVGIYSGSRARALDILVSNLAEAKAELSEIYELPPEALREKLDSGKDVSPRLIKIDGMIEPILEAFIERQIDRSIASGANLIIFEIDSPGGYLLSSTNLAHAIADLDPKQVRTVAYVPNQALSGAAIIALGCDDIILHPEATIGDAGPIEMREGEAFERAPEKILSHLRVTLRDLAEKKGRPPAVAEAMADRNLRVFEVKHPATGRVWYLSEEEMNEQPVEWIKGPLVPESKEDNLLTVNGRRAFELKIAGAPVHDRDELKQRLGIPPETKLVAVGRTWIDTMVFVLNTSGMTVLLFILGIVFIYLELHTMAGLFGILSAVCFSIFFWSRVLGGTAGWLEVVLFLLGIALILLEVFVIPGFGVFGLSGGLLLLMSIVLASQTFTFNNPHLDTAALNRSLVQLCTSVISVIVLAMLLNRMMPRIPFLNRLMLHPPGMETDPNAPLLKPELADADNPNRQLIGLQGTAISMLRPAGKIQIGERYLDVVSEGPFIDEGEQVEVVQVIGNRIVVRQV